LWLSIHLLQAARGHQHHTHGNVFQTFAHIVSLHSKKIVNQ